MTRFDLHSHSTYSDGLLTPAELVMHAAARGVQVLALTDHDESGGLAIARRAAEETGIEFVCGVEISVTWGETHTVHVVGLHVDPGNDALAAGLARLRAGRHRRAEKIASELEQAGIGGSLEGARAYATNPELVGRTHFARYLVERGHARNVHSVFHRYLSSGKPGYVPHTWAGLEQAVGWIKGSGGVAVLAHPGRYPLDGAQREALLKDFVEAGGAAVEVVSSSHGPEQVVLWGGYARRFGLFASTGSDFHGPREGRDDMGKLRILPGGCIPIWERW